MMDEQDAALAYETARRPSIVRCLEQLLRANGTTAIGSAIFDALQTAIVEHSTPPYLPAEIDPSLALFKLAAKASEEYAVKCCGVTPTCAHAGTEQLRQRFFQ